MVVRRNRDNENQVPLGRRARSKSLHGQLRHNKRKIIKKQRSMIFLAFVRISIMTHTWKILKSGRLLRSSRIAWRKLRKMMA